jgi:ribosomal protein S12 methylthiotransferase
VINTCGFIDSAKSEAIDAILQMAQLKAQGLIGKILVTGCLSQRYQQEILQELPEVDGILGTGSYTQIVPAIEALLEEKTVSDYGNNNNACPDSSLRRICVPQSRDAESREESTGRA